MTHSTTNEARRTMVLSQLRPQGVSNPNVLAAMATVEREAYLPAELAPLAYADRPLRLADGSPVLAPAELGRLLNELDPKPGQRALVIGKGGAYSAAVLEDLGLKVTRSDRLDTASGPFDLVLIEGAVETLPDAFAERLAPGGRIGLAIVDRGVTRLCVGRAEGRRLVLNCFADAQVPILPGTSSEPAFTF